MARRYTREEVDAILGRALREDQEEGLSHDELVAAAKEIGVSPDAIARAAENVEQERALEQRTRELRKRQVRAFFTHLTTFLVVCGGLAIMNLLFLPGSIWFPWVVFGWGIGIAMHLRRVLSPDMERMRDRARRSEERRLRREARTRRKHEIEEQAHELGAAVTRGLATAAKAAADKIEEELGPKQVRVEQDPERKRVADEEQQGEEELEETRRERFKKG